MGSWQRAHGVGKYICGRDLFILDRIEWIEWIEWIGRVNGTNGHVGTIGCIWGI